MNSSESVTVNKELFEKITHELNAVLLISNDEAIKNKIEKVLYFIKDSTEIDSKVSISELIYEKMKETRNQNEEIYFNLYMLHRKLEDKKISEDEAKSFYELYMKM